MYIFIQNNNKFSLLIKILIRFEIFYRDFSSFFKFNTNSYRYTSEIVITPLYYQNEEKKIPFYTRNNNARAEKNHRNVKNGLNCEFHFCFHIFVVIASKNHSKSLHHVTSIYLLWFLFRNVYHGVNWRRLSNVCVWFSV